MEIIILISIIFLFGFVNGIISIIRLFSRDKNTSQIFSRQQFLQQIIADLEAELTQYPNDTHLQALRDRYKKELEPTTTLVYVQNSPQNTVFETSPAIPTPQASFWENWYKENSINFLLYLGAFFIVLASIIFLSFTWNTLSGETRFLSFSFFTVCFGIAGMLLYRLEKVTDAGVTFLGITALLIPLNGAAYQRFVLQTTDTNSQIWLATSILSLLAYCALFITMKNRYYAILLNIGSLSLVESFFSFYKPETETYIFGALITSFVLFAGNLFLKNSVAKNVQDTFDGTSQIMLVLSLLYGLMTLSARGNIFVWQAALALLLSGIYYLLRYMVEKNESLIASLLFFGLGMFFTAKFFDATVFTTSIVAMAFAFTCLALSYLYASQKRESLWLAKASIISGVIAHLYLFLPVLSKEATHKEFTILTFLAALLVFGMYRLLQKKELLYLFFAYLIIFLWTCNAAYVVLLFPNHEATTLGFLYATMSFVYAFLYDEKRNTKETFAVGILGGMFLSLSIEYSFTEPIYFSAIAACNLFLSLFLLKKFSENEKIYIPILMFLLFVFSLLKTYDINIQYLWFVETFAAGVLYIFSFIPTEFVTTKTQKNMLQRISLWCIGGFALLAGINYQQTAIVNTTSLLSLVVASVLFTHYSMSQKTQTSMYLASFFWLSVVLRLFYNADITNTQFYIQPVAYYILAWGLWQLKKQLPDAQNYVVLGLFISIMPLFFQSFGQEHVSEAIYLAAEGLVFAGIGISLQEKTFRYGGALAIALAIFAQTSDYILNLPRWLLVGMLGFVILTVAIYLLRTKTKTS